MTPFTRNLTRGLALGASLAVFALASSAVAYTPFTSVNNVCPTCTQPKADVVTTNDGARIRGRVVAENASAYIVLRYGELRSISKTEVQKVEWAAGAKPSGLTQFDQIILKNGHVLSGTIVDDKDKPALFQIKSSEGDNTFMVFKNQAAQVYRAGQESSI